MTTSGLASEADQQSFRATIDAPMCIRESSIRIMKRTGKYQRIDRTGRPIFTFGDPILDMITDEHGWVSVGNETYHGPAGAFEQKPTVLE